jgi:hypothetical protein
MLVLRLSSALSTRKFVLDSGTPEALSAASLSCLPYSQLSCCTPSGRNWLSNRGGTPLNFAPHSELSHIQTAMVSRSRDVQQLKSIGLSVQGCLLSETDLEMYCPPFYLGVSATELSRHPDCGGRGSSGGCSVLWRAAGPQTAGQMATIYSPPLVARIFCAALSHCYLITASQ